MVNRSKRLVIVFVALLLIAAVFMWWNGRSSLSKPMSPKEAIVISTAVIDDKYDVIVVGTDPEGVTAAVSAARNGLHTLLVDGKNRKILGGLFTLGWLNSLDMNRAPGNRHDYLNKGLFGEWYEQVEGDSFDVTTAAVIFNRMVTAEKNIDVLMEMKGIEPVIEISEGNRTVTGVKLVGQDGAVRTVLAQAVIDATQDADIAAAAGAPFTFGREDIGDKEALMVVTPVFQLKHVTDNVWDEIKKRLNGDDNPDTGANEVSAWGYGELWQYPSSRPHKLRTRGLNIGRQNDETALINAIQVFGVNGIDPASREQAMDAVNKELPLIIAYIKEHFPEFAEVELGSLAPELYVRETRHIIGEYRLSMADLLEYRVHWDRIAFGSYPVDIQSTSPKDNGWVLMAPKQYSIPFRSLVPLEVDGLLVVGRSASFDTLPHGSARVVPVGMATGEAAGAAARVAADARISFRELSRSQEQIARLQDKLTKQGMDLKPKKVEVLSYMKHKAYEGLKAAVGMAIAVGSYGNDFGLDQESNPQRMVNNMKGAAKVHKSAFPNGVDVVLEGLASPDKQTLTLEQAAYTIISAIEQGSVRGQALSRLKAKGLLTDDTLKLIANPDELTNGDVYLMLKDAVAGAAGVVYD